MEKGKENFILENIFTRKISLLALAFFLLAPFSLISAQPVKIAPKVIVSPEKPKVKVEQKPAVEMNSDDLPAEKSIAVDAKVNISLCVAEGKIKVRGWDRSEIRAYINQGSKVGFTVLQKNRQNNNVVWVKIVNFETAATRSANPNECLSGDEIELDVPRGASVNIKGRSSETMIDSVRKADVKNVGGDITLNNIEQGIFAGTYEGDVTVENSGGAITLESGNGNIVAFDVAPSEIGDIFKAKTSSGAILIERIEHRQTEITSNSGSIKFIGAFQIGGQYNFGTTNGTISLAIPEQSSCKIIASYGFGAFHSELKLDNIVRNNASRAQSLTAVMGGGDANVKLTTYSGAIRLRKQ